MSADYFVHLALTFRLTRESEIYYLYFRLLLILEHNILHFQISVTNALFVQIIDAQKDFVQYPTGLLF